MEGMFPAPKAAAPLGSTTRTIAKTKSVVPQPILNEAMVAIPVGDYPISPDAVTRVSWKDVVG
jgi:hypothetical protein